MIECVGAPGLMQSLIDLAPYRTRIYAAGGHYTGDHISVTAASQHGVTLQFGGGPQMEDWYGTLDAVVEGRLDPTPAIGMVVGLDGLPDALDLARKSQGPPADRGPSLRIGIAGRVRWCRRPRRTAAPASPGRRR